MTAVPWHRGPLLAVDTETTSAEPETARVVTATAAWITPGQAPDVTTWLIDPGVEIPDEATAVHGITTAHAQAEGRPPAEVLLEITALLHQASLDEVPLVLYNAAFDLTILDRECARHGVPLDLSRALVVDGYVLDKAMDTYRRGSRTLTAVCEHYQVRLDGAHDATADALAAARVVWRIAEMHPVQVQIPLADLHAAQVEWRAQQAASLQDYLRRKDPDAVVDGHWPLIPTREEEVAA